MRLASAFASLLTLAACFGDETVAAYGASGGTWQLQSIGGAPPPGPLTLSFGESGSVTGRAPCNSLSARQTAPYPWFELTALRVTRRACPQLAAEQSLLRSLEAMTLSEVSGDVLILSTPGGPEMLFSR